jgi:hypothetical protein|tara:strand:+ start:3245 stop:3634 length:390 start_codon:yes stop_codon:yes gene_type:complete
MANNTITFNPDSNASAYGVNLVINTRSDFSSTFKVVNQDKSNFNFTSWTASSQMAKSVSIGSSMSPAGTFVVGFTSSINGEFEISMNKTNTDKLKPGRYVWDILVGSGTTVYRLAEGNVTVVSGISAAI